MRIALDEPETSAPTFAIPNANRRPVQRMPREWTITLVQCAGQRVTGVKATLLRRRFVVLTCHALPTVRDLSEHRTGVISGLNADDDVIAGLRDDDPIGIGMRRVQQDVRRFGDDG